MPPRDHASSGDFVTRAALFALGAASILLGVCPQGSYMMVLVGFAVVFFMLRGHLWAALRGGPEDSASACQDSHGRRPHD